MTVPAAAAFTTVPSGAAMSMPSWRCPARTPYRPYRTPFSGQARTASLPLCVSAAGVVGTAGGRGAPLSGGGAGVWEDGPESVDVDVVVDVDVDVDEDGARAAAACAPAGAGSPGTGAAGTSTSRGAPGTNSSAPI